MADISSLKMNSGGEIPVIGFGTWALSEGEETKQAVLTAFDAGYRLIDTAKMYGNERSVGAAIEESGLERECIFITTKLWRDDQGYESALAGFEESRKKLNVDYIDLYLIHSPNGSDRAGSWKALQKLYKDGAARAVGVSNYRVEHLEEVLDQSNLIPAVNQIEFHPFNYGQQAPILEFCKQHKIIVEAYSPLAKGNKMDNKTLSRIAKIHSKTPAQVMLRWALQHGTVPIPKSSTARRIEQNIDIFDFELSASEMEEVNSLSSGYSVIG